MQNTLFRCRNSQKYIFEKNYIFESYLLFYIRNTRVYGNIIMLSWGEGGGTILKSSLHTWPPDLNTKRGRQENENTLL